MPPFDCWPRPKSLFLPWNRVKLASEVQENGLWKWLKTTSAPPKCTRSQPSRPEEASRAHILNQLGTEKDSTVNAVQTEICRNVRNLSEAFSPCVHKRSMGRHVRGRLSSFSYYIRGVYVGKSYWYTQTFWDFDFLFDLAIEWWKYRCNHPCVTADICEKTESLPNKKRNSKG